MGEAAVVRGVNARDGGDGPAPLVELAGVSKRFNTDPAVAALVAIDLRVCAGEWVAIVGPSGSGKSTLLNVVGCLDTPTEGSYCLGGIEVGRLSDRARAGLRSQAIGFVFQSFHLLSHRSVLDNVRLADVYRHAPRRGRSERAHQVLERVGLAHRAQFPPTRLSGGERQRAAIARALMGSPQLLLCDEPTGNLDSATSATVLDLLETLNEDGVTIMMITHETDVARRANRQVQLVDGSIRADESRSSR